MKKELNINRLKFSALFIPFRVFCASSVTSVANFYLNRSAQSRSSVSVHSQPIHASVML